MVVSGELGEAISRSAVRVYGDYLGRGAARAQAFFRRRTVVVVLRDTMTPGERSLVEHGEPERAQQMRRLLHATMRADLVAAVEDLTGCSVAALLSDYDPASDLAAHLFALDADCSGGRAVSDRTVAADSARSNA
jgi:uncharacterized protein YbcI